MFNSKVVGAAGLTTETLPAATFLALNAVTTAILALASQPISAIVLWGTRLRGNVLLVVDQ